MTGKLDRDMQQAGYGLWAVFSPMSDLDIHRIAYHREISNPIIREVLVGVSTHNRLQPPPAFSTPGR